MISSTFHKLAAVLTTNRASKCSFVSLACNALSTTDVTGGITNAVIQMCVFLGTLNATNVTDQIASTGIDVIAHRLNICIAVVALIGASIFVGVSTGLEIGLAELALVSAGVRIGVTQLALLANV